MENQDISLVGRRNIGQYLAGESRGWQLDVEGKLWLHCPCVGLVWALCWKYASSVTGIIIMLL